MTHPLWQARQLGLPIPDSPHATSVCLPTWADNVAYEEGEKRVVDALQAGYPRFVFNPLVTQLTEQWLSKGRTGIILGCEASAERCRKFMAPIPCDLQRLRKDAWLISTSENALEAPLENESPKTRLRAFWQHTGEGISSRVAAELLNVSEPSNEGTTARTEIRTRISSCLGTDEKNCRLYPSGMAAVASAWRIARSTSSNKRTIQFGFPYVDTLKLQERFGEVQFIQTCDDAAYDTVESACATGDIAAVFCELPANPLLNSPDLDRLSRSCRKHNVLLVVDDTIATSVNVDVTPHADLITTSLTKAFSGAGDVIAGALSISPQAPNADELHQLLVADKAPQLASADACVLAANSRDYSDRVAKMTQSSQRLCAMLKTHASIAEIRYPAWTNNSIYERHRRPNGGYGNLFSIILHNPETATPAFFDKLKISKGPSLGTNFSLACPYTILAHHHELDKVEACGVSRWLVRVSVGLEDADDLIGRFQEALSA